MEQLDYGPPVRIPGPRLLLGVGATEDENTLELVIDTEEPGPGNSMVAHVDKAEFFNFFTLLGDRILPNGGLSFFDGKNKQTVAIIRDMIYPGSFHVCIISPTGRALVSRPCKIADFLNFA